MELKIFSGLPDCAREIRQKVFVDEQGFKTEFDDIDETAIHLVGFDGNTPAATCRIFKDKDDGVYILGRLAVLKEYRGKRLGAYVLNEAERYVREIGGKCIVLHAQVRASGFYKKAGYFEFGDEFYDEYCPHISMKKCL